MGFFTILSQFLGDQKWWEVVLNPFNNIMSISLPHDSFIASVYSFTSSCSAFLLRTVLPTIVLYGGVSY